MKQNRLKTLVMSLFLLSLFNITSATSYYLSAEGNDTNSGTSSADAWKSLNKLNKLVPKPGDSIFFRSGDEWSGTISVNMWGMEDRPVVYTSYGDGEKPKIYGSEIITGWTKHKGQIYKAKVDKKINQLFVNGNKMQVARIPDNGYATVSEVINSKQFSSNELPSGIDYSEAVWFGRTGYYHTPVQRIISSNSNSLVLDDEPENELNKGEGFILMNKPEFISKPEEWSYNASTNTVYLWLPENATPDNSIIRGTVFDYGFIAKAKNYIEIRNLNISHQAVAGIEIGGGRNWTIDDNDFCYPDAHAINDESKGENHIISNNRIIGANHLAIQLRTDKTTVADNEILETALLKNIGISGTGRYYYGSAVFIVGKNNVVKYNRIIDTHYNGIFFAGPGNLIEYNFIENICLVKSDGGGVYTTQPGSNPTTGSVIRYNLVKNSVGSREGFTSKVSFGEGIYIDESAHGVTVEHNTVYNISNAGIKMHRTDACIIRHNTIMDARYGIQIVHSSGNVPDKVTNNILYSTANGCRDKYEPRQLLVRTSSANAVFENNIYRNPYERKGIFRGDNYCSFDEWTKITGYDKNSDYTEIELSAGESEKLIYNDAKTSKTINLGRKSYADIFGNTFTGSITLEPFTSIILIGNDFALSATP